MFQLSRVIQLAMDNSSLLSVMEKLCQFSFHVLSNLIKRQLEPLDSNFIQLCIALCTNSHFNSNSVICQAKISVLHSLVSCYKLNQTPMIMGSICQITKQYATNKSIQRKVNQIWAKQVTLIDKNLAQELTNLSLLTSANDKIMASVANVQASVSFLHGLQSHVKQIYFVDRVNAFLVKSVCLYGTELPLIKQAIGLLAISLEQVVVDEKFKSTCLQILQQFSDEKALISQIINLFWFAVSKEMFQTDETMLQIMCQVAKQECLNKEEALHLIWHHFRRTTYISQNCSQLVAIPLMHMYCHELSTNTKQLTNINRYNQLIQTISFCCQKSQDTCQYVIANTTIAMNLIQNEEYCLNETLMESITLLLSHLSGVSTQIAKQLVPYINQSIPLFCSFFANEYICSHILQLLVNCVENVKASQEESSKWLDFSLRVFKIFGNRKTILEHGCKLMVVFCQCQWNANQMVQVKYGEEGLFAILTNLQLLYSNPPICQVSLQALSEMAKHVPYQSIIGSQHNIQLLHQILSTFLASNLEITKFALALLIQITNPFVLDSLEITKQMCQHSRSFIQFLSKALTMKTGQVSIIQWICQLLEQICSTNANQQQVIFDLCCQGSFELLLNTCRDYSDNAKILTSCVSMMDAILSIPSYSDFYKFKLLRQEKGILCQSLQFLLSIPQVSTNPIIQRMVQHVNGFEEKKGKLVKKGKIRDWIERDFILNRLHFFYMKENRKVKTLIDLKGASCECIVDAKCPELQQEWYEAIMYCIENAGSQNGRKKVNVDAINQQVVKQRSATVTASVSQKKALPVPVKSNTTSVQSSPKVGNTSSAMEPDEYSEVERYEDEDEGQDLPVHPTRQ